LAVTILAAVLPLVVPRATGWAFDRAVLAARPEDNPWMLLAGALAAILTAHGALFLATWMRDVAAARVAERVTRELRLGVWEKVGAIGPLGIAEVGAGTLAHRILTDARGLQSVVSPALAGFVTAPLLLAGMGVVLAAADVRIAAAALVPVPVLAVAAWWRDRALFGAHEGARAAEERIARFVHERLHAAEAAALGARWDAQRLGRLAQDAAAIRLHVARATAAYHAALTAGFAAGVVAVLVAGVRGVLAGSATPGDVVTALGYVSILAQPLASVSRARALWHALDASAAAVADVLDLPEPRDGSAPVPEGPLDIELRDVRFAYGGVEVLRGVTARFAAGEWVAVSGPSGSGKTTLARLLTRLADPTGGSVRLGGVDLRDLRRDGLRSAVAAVPQEPAIFSGSVADNIAWARPEAPMEEIRAAAAAAACEGFASDLTRTLESRLSAGEKQRIAIARALLLRPRVLVLDEATSALDEATEARVLDGISRFLPGATVVVLTHRRAPVERCARRWRIVDGQLVAEDLAGESGI
jgi:ABC-type multidrug transport system fused ATPase/permease subunit